MRESKHGRKLNLGIICLNCLYNKEPQELRKDRAETRTKNQDTRIRERCRD